MKCAACVVWVSLSATAFAGPPPKNIIFMIGDGMGFEHVKAGGMYAHGAPGTLFFESLPYKGQVSTGNYYGDVTDSAAASTAMATGLKVANRVLSEAVPARGSYASGAPFTTILEIAKSQGKSTGLVTTSPIDDATPAAFAAHVSDRGLFADIANFQFDQNHVNVLMGGTYGLPDNIAQNGGYTVVDSLTSLQTIDPDTTTYLSGQYGTYFPFEAQGVGAYPHLSQMTAASLDVLDNDPDGFFLMVEGGLIDPAAHANNTANMVPEVVEFSNAVQTAFNWAAGRTDTLVVVTADHETGGITVLQNNGIGVLPTIQWTSAGHTGVNVPLYAWGVNGSLLTGVIDNTQFFQILQSGSSPLIGDVNLDGTVNALDISGFIHYFTGGGAARTEADCNRDGVVNALDIAGFLRAMTPGGEAQAIPEPTVATALLCVWAVCHARRPRR